jgi:hypothetical protein
MLSIFFDFTKLLLEGLKFNLPYFAPDATDPNEIKKQRREYEMYKKPHREGKS